MRTVLTTDHPAWQEADEARVRAVRTESGTWVITFDHDGLHTACAHGTEDVKPEFVTTDPDHLPTAAPTALRAGLLDLGATQRLANPWLWDAITTAILRQVVRADQARKLYRAWCRAYGTALEGPGADLGLAPTPEQVLDLSDEQFAAVGAKFHRSALQASARHYLRESDRWSRLEADDLIAALTSVPRIGPWTAAAAACDYTGDFASYPHDDLAVRTWAAKIAPSYPWPDKKDKTFGPLWTGWAGTDRTALHTLTLATLTWGSNAGATRAPNGSDRRG
ncbi:hypothetical protein [Streptacidiphilus sp. MAP5-3]|uniref:hypothetical protein n=1 Tax=unclassified Streptacidiphilus TaxID=2643834 RepID=UPI0035188954